MTCKDCIYEKICDNLISQGLPWKDGKYPAEKFCDQFKNKADVVEVVRCKDCQYCEYDYCKYPNQMDKCVHPTHYCSYGERREE